MPEKKQAPKICPYLGLEADNSSHFSYPESAHICLVTDEKAPITLEHQRNFCLGERCISCSKYVEPTGLPVINDVRGNGRDSTSTKTLLYAIGGAVIGLLLIIAIVFSSNGGSNAVTATAPIQAIVRQPSATLTASATATQIATSTSMPPTNTANAGSILVSQNIDTPVTPVADGKIITLNPPISSVGWVSSGDSRRNHFGDSYLYAGVFNKRTYLGGFQIDLNSIPRGAPVYYGVLRITGLRGDLLAVQNGEPDNGQAWTVSLLNEKIDDAWFSANYQVLLNSETLQTLEPLLSASDLGKGEVNEFELTTQQLRLIRDKVINNLEPRLSFRVTGPLAGEDNLFAWDTGYGSQSDKNKIELILSIGEPPVTPIPFNYVVVTSTPTPENVVTAAAIVQKMTADATRIGTATPSPPNMVTATPIPRYLVLEPSPTPGNLETATAQMVLATAQALTTGTPTPLPPDIITATPLPSPSPTGTATPAQYVLITTTPTPASIFAAATQAVRLTTEAQIFGTPTPLPLNWVTPVVSTATPIPGNAATAQALAALATAEAITTGTPSPTPENSVLATPTAVFEEIAMLPTPTPPAGGEAEVRVPAELLGKILFKSDRDGDPLAVYVYDPVTKKLGRLSDPWPYDLVYARNAYSADKRFKAYTRVPEFSDEARLQIHLIDNEYGYNGIVTHFSSGNAYDSVISPVSDKIALVATESGNDDIWTVNFDGTDLQRLTVNNWEGDKSPSWSPDGTEIVFYSNSTGSNQLWIMNADGTEQRLLFGWANQTPYNDINPLWVKYLDTAP